MIIAARHEQHVTAQQVMFEDCGARRRQMGRAPVLERELRGPLEDSPVLVAVHLENQHVVVVIMGTKRAAGINAATLRPSSNGITASPRA